MSSLMISQTDYLTSPIKHQRRSETRYTKRAAQVLLTARNLSSRVEQPRRLRYLRTNLGWLVPFEKLEPMSCRSGKLMVQVTSKLAYC